MRGGRKRCQVRTRSISAVAGGNACLATRAVGLARRHGKRGATQDGAGTNVAHGGVSRTPITGHCNRDPNAAAHGGEQRSVLSILWSSNQENCPRFAYSHQRPSICIELDISKYIVEFVSCAVVDWAGEVDSR